VGIGLLSEIYYHGKKNKNFILTEKILRLYDLPVNLNEFYNNKYKNIIKKKIFNNIFLDKKRIGKYPRYIKLLDVGKTKIDELKNYNKIRETIQTVIFSK
jgi:3-dehydroquinate synthetase